MRKRKVILRILKDMAKEHVSPYISVSARAVAKRMGIDMRGGEVAHISKLIADMLSDIIVDVIKTNGRTYYVVPKEALLRLGNE